MNWWQLLHEITQRDCRAPATPLTPNGTFPPRRAEVQVRAAEVLGDGVPPAYSMCRFTDATRPLLNTLDPREGKNIAAWVISDMGRKPVMIGSQPPTTAIRGAHAVRTYARQACALFTRGHPVHPPTFARTTRRAPRRPPATGWPAGASRSTARTGRRRATGQPLTGMGDWAYTYDVKGR